MNLKSQSGSILLTTLSFIALLGLAAGSILQLTMNSYKLTMRNEMRAQARAVAESELESIWYQWVGLIMGGVPATTTPTTMVETMLIADTFGDPPTDREAFLLAHKSKNWVVHRSVEYNAVYDFFEGMLDQETQGKVTYITVRIEVLPPETGFFKSELAVRVGRRFATTNASIFQYGVFYQGDLEMAPGNDITIDGNVSANGSIYMASSPLAHLTLNRKVKYLSGHYFNADSSNPSGVLRKPGTLVGGSLIAPLFLTSQTDQVSELDAPINLLGGLDPLAIQDQRDDLFESENDVYRAAIMPPPEVAPEEYPDYDGTGDDPTINASRMYTRAGLRITVNTDGNVVFTNGAGADVTSSYTGDIIDPDNTLLNYGPIVVGIPNTDMYDQREVKDVKMTTINMEALIKAVQFNFPDDPESDFNGAFYFHVVGSNSTTPRAIKITNAEDVSGRKGLGTTVTTNGGLYVQGNYNTASTDLPDGTSNVAMLMADQVTVLSSNWDDANATSDVTSRAATSDIFINAGILTGNTSATISQASGGAQNLVRYLENWSGYNVNIYGSLGRLFESKTFHSAFQQPGVVYLKPAARNFIFDANLIKHPPAGSPTTTKFERGSFFVWNP